MLQISMGDGGKFSSGRHGEVRDHVEAMWITTQWPDTPRGVEDSMLGFSKLFEILNY